MSAGRRMAGALAWAAVVLSAVAAAAGLFWSGLYRDVPFWVEQARGIDLATLFLAVPILAVSLLMAERAWSPARLLVIGVLLYLIYNYVIYTTSIAMNRMALIYIAILGLSVWSLLLFVIPVVMGSVSVPIGNSSLARIAAIFLIIVVVLFALLWLSQIAGSTASGSPPQDLKRSGLPANPVYALDLAIFLPLAAIAAVGVLRGMTPAESLATPMLLWIFLTSAGIVGGFLFEARAGEQVPTPVALVVSLIGIIALALAGMVVTVGARTSA